MKTGDLISALAVDAKPQGSLARVFAIALAGAIGSAAILFFLHLGPRHDFLQAAQTLRFDFKFVLTLSLAASALILALRVVRPEIQVDRAILFAAPALLAGAIILELIFVPSADWLARLIGHNAIACLSNIPLLSILPLALILMALRQGAPANPVLAGAVAGLLASGIGASFYAAHCFDDSPLFVAVWYSLAIGLVTGLGALAGPRLLRW